MKNISFYLIFGIVCGIEFVDSFFSSETTESLLFFEVNIWINRLFWGLAALSAFYSHFKGLKKKQTLAEEAPQAKSTKHSQLQ
jgi:hypothetical protein